MNALLTDVTDVKAHVAQDEHGDCERSDVGETETHEGYSMERCQRGMEEGGTRAPQAKDDGEADEVHGVTLCDSKM